MLKISIPAPCHQDWDGMSPKDQGRHCTACSKTVIDFTAMNDEEVSVFLIGKKNERICGRFKTEQLHRSRIALPLNILQLQMPWWKRFLVASLIIFGTTLFSCETSIKGEPSIEKHSLQDRVKLPAEMEPTMTNGMVIRWDTTMRQDDFNCTTTKSDAGEVNFNLQEEQESEILMTGGFTGDSSEITPVGQIITGDTIIIQPAGLILKSVFNLIENAPKKDSTRCDSIPKLYF